MTTELKLIFPSDSITATVFHELDEARHPPTTAGADGALEYRYNFLRYEFATPSGTVHARSYLDQIKRVSIHLEPHQRNEPLIAQIERYLARRYRVVRLE
jgi:hypothetical protein